MEGGAPDSVFTQIPKNQSELNAKKIGEATVENLLGYRVIQKSSAPGVLDFPDWVPAEVQKDVQEKWNSFDPSLIKEFADVQKRFG